VRQVFSKIKNFFWLCFKALYWYTYLQLGWLVQFLKYLVQRNFMIIHDLLFTAISLVRRKGSSFSRTKFFLKSRLFTPRKLWNALKNRGNHPQPLPQNWNTLRKTILDRDNYKCNVCKAEDLELHVDHVIPRKYGGSNDESNLRTLCKHCHICRHFRKI